ncbi:precorrin-2 dehydrogenase/sirohydrochlorin ferrochelatase [Clostridium acetobutylicum]|uniref:precorrin-2 dehydrogenase n=1 Tax=Clostridium acetobutylicum (strain ATCC 824 / DSM 792 / JCM 1419 / IAM 19013 / LMG 5710 / NBRC 13948 / NRRL B-527 / VKM B-1787 / 2291 / W) TaxID=272562 RepID=Q97MU5_CLOAB|nr:MULTISPECIES: NAD(P)-dependent oxidoreductase [Clostridium]AAK78081.1 Precorrin-2 dehydrogenase [Clostridium acetobutylicum ATCC 824]ADZ19140.1 precorrin-2 dehydrogenase [Clostridium acetobutylicum EA 2018]AEI33957.1 precorrin-2 dehydrogenase [Clostridium acetobutylicum DSM 1731]AWV81856.1 NAD(P)-dependent oxidoreductase [Clostridium acetobutylicum]MBC2395404.1 NAD(P)-dependent oxidoreductase [Clostridium acetobutylicum]
MPKDIKKDISEVENLFIALVSPKLKILVIGGGNAALIKVRNFIKMGCLITIVSKEFKEEFNMLSGFPNIKLIKGEYLRDYLKHYHIIIIATNNFKLNDKIRQDCDYINKMYMDCGEPEKGLYIVPYQNDSKMFSLSIKSRYKSPKTSKYVLDKAMTFIKRYEDFSEYTANIRNKIKGSRKKEIMNFVCSDDFYFFYKKRKADIVLQMFYRELNGE